MEGLLSTGPTPSSFKLSALKVSSALAGLSASRSGQLYVCSDLGSNLATVPSDQISELCQIPSGRI